MKRLLLLGGSTQQIAAIEYANRQGYYTVLCDYLSDNPGQKYAKKFYCMSTTDKESILEIAKMENVDGVVAYASDPAAPTAAYVAEKLGLPTNSYKAVEILAYKDKFRKFLLENNFNCPYAKNFSSYDEIGNEINNFIFPVMVKPVDSSGSKGVRKIDSIDEFAGAFNEALSMSRNKRVIVEEFIELGDKYIIGGDCFVIDKKVAFLGLLNCHRDENVNPLVPSGKSYPTNLGNEKREQINLTIQKIVDLLGIKFGAFNLELMFDKNGKLYLIEMGPRNGGNMIPELLYKATGIDMVSATVETALGNNNIYLNNKRTNSYYSTYNIHSSKDGVLDRIEFSDELKKRIIKKVIYKNEGDRIEVFDGANKALGIIFMKFSSQNEMFSYMEKIDDFIKIIFK